MNKKLIFLCLLYSAPALPMNPLQQQFQNFEATFFNQFKIGNITPTILKFIPMIGISVINLFVFSQEAPRYHFYIDLGLLIMATSLYFYVLCRYGLFRNIYNYQQRMDRFMPYIREHQ